MRGLLGALGFLAGMQLLAAAIVFVGFLLIRSFGLSDDSERTAIGWLAFLALIATGLIARAAHRRIERRR
jgi:predicted membrane-bound spermidine synthase